MTLPGHVITFSNSHGNYSMLALVQGGQAKLYYVYPAGRSMVGVGVACVVCGCQCRVCAVRIGLVDGCVCHGCVAGVQRVQLAVHAAAAARAEQGCAGGSR